MPTTRDALIIAIFFLIPGFVADALIGKQFERRKREPTEIVLNILLLTLINYIVWSVLLLWMEGEANRVGYAAFIRYNRGWCLVVAIVVLFISPAALAALVGRFSRKEGGRQFLHNLFSVKLDDPEAPPSVWDFIFTETSTYQIIATFPDGSKVAGGFAGESRVSTYPEEQEIYLEVLYSLSDDGKIIGPPIELSKGILIKRADLRSLEFYSVSSEEGGQNGAAQVGEQAEPGASDDAGDPAG